MAALKRTRTIFQLPDVGTWFENIAIRSSGSILASRVDVPELWEIDPTTGKGSVAVTFPSPNTGVTGITELTRDVFAVGVGQYGLTSGTVPGSFAIWAVDLNQSPPVPRQVVSVSTAGLINGLTTWDATTVLAADSEYGALYRVDLGARTADKTIADELMTSPAGSPMQVGINGVKLRDGYVYFTNSMRQTFFRVPVDALARATGPVEAVASGFTQDDFVFDVDGAAYVASNPGNTVVRVAAGVGEGEVIAGNVASLDLAGGTACAFGRGDGDARTLYVVTAGALAGPVNGNQVEPAKVVAVDL